jgi:ABC-type phosphate/phosphonate transport system substrate-binding protein
MKFSKIMLTGLLAAIAITSSYAATSGNQTITYKNQRGSTLVLNFVPTKNNTGNLTGTFTTLVGDCAANMGVPMPVTGYFNDNVVSLSINFPECNQSIAMTGHLTSNKAQLQTMWLDAAVVADPHNKDWNSTNIGTDFYKKV